jgi:hypothetical protein
MNGYCQLELLGRTRGLKFGALAAEQILISLAKLNIETQGFYSNSMLAIIIYWGMFNNCYAKREDPDFTFEQVVDWVDEYQFDDDKALKMADVVKCFEESKSSKLLTEKINQEAEKKKVMEQSGSASNL